jgi:Inner membrane component of T3SS, cytoplasmic domain
MTHRMSGGASPRLIVTTPSHLRGAVFTLPSGRSVLGRAPHSALRLDDPHVSRAHAALRRDATGTTLEDLGSSGGTVVNGIPVAGVRRLRHGDLLGFGTVQVRFEEQAEDGAPTMVGTMRPVPAAAAPPGPAARFDIGPQTGGAINNVGGNQYNHILQQRESFLREVAAAKTRARRLVQVGLVLFLAGFTLATVGIVRYGGSVADFVGQMGPEPPTGGLDVDFAAFGLALVGGAIANIAVVVMVVGLVMHIVAAARRRRINDQIRY